MLHLGSYNLDWKAALHTQQCISSGIRMHHNFLSQICPTAQALQQPQYPHNEHTSSLMLKLIMSNNMVSIWRCFGEQLIPQSCNAWIFLLACVVSLGDQLMSFSSQLVISELNTQHTQMQLEDSSKNLKRSFVEVARTETCSQHRSLFPASHSLFWHIHPTAAPHSLLHSPDEFLPPACPSRHTLHREAVSWTIQLLGVWLF